MSIMRAEITMSAANTFTEQQIRLPTDPASRLGMRILSVASGFNAILPSAFPAADAFSRAGLDFAINVRQGLTTEPDLGDPGTVYRRTLTTLLGSAPADAGVAINAVEQAMPAFMQYNPGIVVATTELSLYMNSDLQTDARVARVMFQYEFVRLTAEELVTALSLTETL